MEYADFKQQWLEDVISGNPSTVELGRRFSRKLVANWLDFDEDTDDIVFCDGSGDGGIDVACLIINDTQEEGSENGNTWYIVQSKHGSAFAGTNTILIEGQKILQTLTGRNNNLSSLAEGLTEKLRTFITNTGPNDKLRLVYATHDPVSEMEKAGIESISILGKSLLGNCFDVDCVSIQTIYNNLLELESKSVKTVVKLMGNLAPSGSGLRVGAVGLLEIYDFLKSYKQTTGELDQLYEKNVRKYLGGGRVVNKGIASTLLNEPEKFGLYNNGITIVAEDFLTNDDNSYTVIEPFVVNGCQTTKTIWDTFDKKLNSGAATLSKDTQLWKDRLRESVVVVKLVKVGIDGEKLLTEITRFTNSQNSVGRQDFISLENNFRTWASVMSSEYDIYLEIHRGGWDSQKLLQRTRLSGKIYTEHANAFDLLKIYGAAWLAEPGTAFGKNPPFAPGGFIFKRIMETKTFNVKDLYSSYLLQKLANKIGFGRKTEYLSRRQTKFLFYYILVDLLKDVLINSGLPHDLNDLTIAVIKIFKDMDNPAAVQLSELALNVIDNYMADGAEDSIFNEPEFIRTRDLNLYLKWDKLGRGREYTPKFEQQLYLNKFLMSRAMPGQQPARQAILNVLKSTL